MKIVEFSVLLFKDKKHNIVVEKRGGFTRNNEKFAFFGGEITNKRSPPECLKEKLSEELGYIPNDLSYVGDYIFDIKEGKYAGNKIHYYLYFASITEKLLKTTDLVGGKVIKIKIHKIKNHSGFFQADRDLINQLCHEGKLIIA